MKILGLMSGTSLDGIDCALIETDGEKHIEFGGSTTYEYDAPTRELLRQTLDEAQNLPTNKLTRAHFRMAEQLVTDQHILAVEKFIREFGKPELIGFHGQTIAHRPYENFTLQLGDGARLAKVCQINTIADFRSADIKAGGEGAPFAPLFHAALLQRAKITQPMAVINIGGVANLTYCDEDNILAFDTGPGNALIDDWVRHHSDVTYDKDGALALHGTIQTKELDTLLGHSYFTRPPPKSLDRLEFAHNLTCALEDGAATLTAFTARSIVRALAFCPFPPAQIVLCGGGRHNHTLIHMIAKYANTPTLICEDLGWDGDVLEAQAFAWLAARSCYNLPLSLPSTTGVPAPQNGGHYFAATLDV